MKKLEPSGLDLLDQMLVIINFSETKLNSNNKKRKLCTSLVAMVLEAGAPIRSRIWDLVPNGTKVLKRSQKSPYFASQVPNFSFISINERIASI